jgi:hypothetical protein
LDKEKRPVCRKTTHFDESSNCIEPLEHEQSNDLSKIAEETVETPAVTALFLGKASLSARAETMSRFRVLALQGDVFAQYKLGIYIFSDDSRRIMSTKRTAP